MRADFFRLVGLAAALTAQGCATAPRAPLPEPLPPLALDQVVTRPVVPAPPAATAADVPRITFTAANVPLREVLPLIAEAAGVTLVLDPAVGGLVSFHFDNTPALEALEVLARQAGYHVALGPASPALPFVPRTVFMRPPVNINVLGAAAIQERFGVGRELAEWIVLSRPAWRW